MLSYKLLIAVFVFVLCVEFSCQNGASNDIDGGIFGNEVQLDLDDIEFQDGSDHSHNFRKIDGIIIYVMQKGCTYVMSFVKNRYYHNHHIQPITRSNCDWRLYVQKSCVSHHVPPELCCALMQCGLPYSLIAIGAPKETVAQCNMTSVVDSMHGISSMIGRRSTSSESSSGQIDPIGMCTEYISNILAIMGKRRIPMNTTIDQALNSIALPNYQSSHPDFGSFLSTLLQAWRGSTRPVMPTLPPVTATMKNWCRTFSRSIHKRYHFNETKFVRSSVYWIVDIYKIAHEHRVSTNFTHALVGCGMSYALEAFNAESWQTLLYKLVL
ncbi:hypothetical protein ACF0H5_004496 [Mactra antiquata]